MGDFAPGLHVAPMWGRASSLKGCSVDTNVSSENAVIGRMGDRLGDGSTLALSI